MAVLWRTHCNICDRLCQTGEIIMPATHSRKSQGTAGDCAIVDVDRESSRYQIWPAQPQLTQKWWPTAEEKAGLDQIPDNGRRTVPIQAGDQELKQQLANVGDQPAQQLIRGKTYPRVDLQWSQYWRFGRGSGKSWLENRSNLTKLQNAWGERYRGGRSG